MAANRLRTVEVDGLLGRVLLGKYRVDAILGHGGVGVVAACTHLALNERVAIKMLRENALDSEDSVERFMREAQAAAKLRSEYVARVTDVGKLETDVPYMVMELLDGQDLGKLIQLHGSLPAPSVVDLAIQTADALAEAHSHGIVHRDIKPSNLFVVGDDGWTVKVLDFGISKSPAASEMRLTQTQSLLGTPAYMSPEQMRSARLVDARTDIWSLGIVMYEALEGRLPFPADSFSEMCLKVCSDPQPPMSRTPPKLAHVVEKCLAKEPDERYQSMAQLARDLVRFATDPARAQMIVERADRVTRRSMSMLAIRPTPVPAPRPRKKWPFIAAPLLAVAIGTTLGLWVGGRGDDAAAADDVPAAVAPPAPKAEPPPPPPEPTKAAVVDPGSDRAPDPPEINIPDPPADPPAADPAKPARPRVPFKRPVIRKPPVKKTTPCKADNSMDGC